MPSTEPSCVTTILRVAVPSPLRQLFDYLLPHDSGEPQVPSLPGNERPPSGGSRAADEGVPAALPGARVRVPFGRRQLVGVVVAVVNSDALPSRPLKPVLEILDPEPVLPPALLNLLVWAADYYQHPIGEALQQALPVLLRQGGHSRATQPAWRLTGAGLGLPDGALRRAPQQMQALSLLLREGIQTPAQLAAQGLSAAALRALAAKGLAERIEITETPATPARATGPASAPAPSDEQQTAIAAVAQSFGQFQCHLLEGVTGSGKTEVYLQLIDQVLARGEQALVLIPEIGLTPQTLARFQRRLATPIALLHSGLTDAERLHAWRTARDGSAGVVLGTRSAVFAELARPGLIVVDEEHDASYKQQEGFRYSARDLAIKRAADGGFPVLLGSATPSLESLHNALSGRYGHCALHARAGAAELPAIEIVDIRRAAMHEGLAPAAVDAVRATLARGEQALVFINRRGFAPTLLCHDCGWIAGCNQCDARLTVHYGVRRLRCHHCGAAQPLPPLCPECRSPALEFRGPGTERLEHALTALCPGTPVYRVDRDTTGRKLAMQTLVEEIRRGEPAILVGTQMLAKGHHFPAVTLVILVDADGGLFSADFRGPERLGQLLTQVAGRAGRGGGASRVLLQTHYPDHPLISSLVRDGYHRFARGLLEERRQLGLPPFGHLALLRADAVMLRHAETLLADLRQQLPQNDAVRAIGPLPAPLSRRAGMHRAQLLLHAAQRASLHHALSHLIAHTTNHPLQRRVHWSVDVDPIDFV